MNFHPHIHMILLGGGLTPKNEWKDNGTEFFLPIWAISKVFRGKYMDELKNLWNTDQLEFHGTAEKYRNHYEFKELIDSCYDTEWVPYCKKTFNGAQSVIDYLGNIPMGSLSAITASSIWMMKMLLFLLRITGKKDNGRN